MAGAVELGDEGFVGGVDRLAFAFRVPIPCRS